MAFLLSWVSTVSPAVVEGNVAGTFPRSIYGRGVAVLLLVLVSLRVALSGPQPDVLLIVWDTVRARSVTPATAPGLYARPGRRYLHAISPAIWTLPGHASLFTGLPVRSHGAFGHRQLADVQTLAERFASGGYATFLYSSNPYVSEETGLTRGFERVETSWDPRARHRGLLRGAAIEETLFQWKQTHEQPSFAVLNYMEAHVPRVPSAEARSRFSDPYEAAIWDLDRLTKPVIDRWDGLVVVTSDHGELRGEHGLEGHHGGLWEELVHVPLFVFGEGIDGTVSEPFSTAGVGGILLGAAGLPVPAQVPPFSERRGPEPPHAGATQVSVRDGMRKWISGVGVFDLAEDPLEKSPLPSSEALEERASDFERDWPVREGPPAGSTEHLLLQRLGYVAE